MGKYHPHGDQAIYDTLVRMAQEFSLRYPLVGGKGNFGSIDDDPAAAMRYTEARLDRLATEMLRDIEAETVDFGPNYDEKAQEPLVLPARFPNLLVNGSSGIAVGMATNIPPHNLTEIAAAVSAYIDNPEIDLAGLMEHVKGPDFPGGGLIMRGEGIRDAYASGRGSIQVRAKAHIEPIKGGKEAIIVSELPFMVKKGGDAGLITKIADLVREKKITGISDLRDESDRSGMRLVIEVKRGEMAKAVLNQLYKRTQMQTSFGVNMVALVDNVPRTLGLRELVHHYVAHQREVVTRRTQYELRRAEARAHILEGLLIALDNLDEVIALIRGSKDPETARTGLIERFELSDEQAQAILDMRLQRLTALESDKVRSEHAELLKRIANLRAILGDESQIDGLINDELGEIATRYGDERRSEITFAEGDVDIEDMIADQQMVISITHSGYVKRLPLATYRQQRRGGVGVMGMDLKEGDYIEHLHICSTHDWMLFFTNRGKVYRLKVYELPEGARTSKGKALVNVLPLRDGERVMAVKPTRDFSEGKYLVFATAKGLVKKTEFRAYNTPIRADGIIAIKVRDGDELVQVRLTSGADDLLLVSKSGNASRFSEKAVRPMGRDTSGVKGMNVAGKVDRVQNRVLAMDVARDDSELFVVTENGYGKRTAVAEYPVKGRGTKGVLTAKLTAKKGGLAGALIVREHQDLLFISENGMVQRTNAGGISQMGRATQGVRVMNMKEDDRVSAVALVVESGDLARRRRDRRRGGGQRDRPGRCRRRLVGRGRRVVLFERRDGPESRAAADRLRGHGPASGPQRARHRRRGWARWLHRPCACRGGRQPGAHRPPRGACGRARGGASQSRGRRRARPGRSRRPGGAAAAGHLGAGGVGPAGRARQQRRRRVRWQLPAIDARGARVHRRRQPLGADGPDPDRSPRHARAPAGPHRQCRLPGGQDARALSGHLRGHQAWRGRLHALASRRVRRPARGLLGDLPGVHQPGWHVRPARAGDGGGAQPARDAAPRECRRGGRAVDPGERRRDRVEQATAAPAHPALRPVPPDRGPARSKPPRPGVRRALRKGPRPKLATRGAGATRLADLLQWLYRRKEVVLT